MLFHAVNPRYFFGNSNNVLSAIPYCNDKLEILPNAISCCHFFWEQQQNNYPHKK